jgi:hypothetical protein
VVAFLEVGLEDSGPGRLLPEVGDHEVDEQEGGLADDQGGDVDRAEVVAQEDGQADGQGWQAEEDHQPPNGVDPPVKGASRRVWTPSRPSVAQVTYERRGTAPAG